MSRRIASLVAALAFGVTTTPACMAQSPPPDARSVTPSRNGGPVRVEILVESGPLAVRGYEGEVIRFVTKGPDSALTVDFISPASVRLQGGDRSEGLEVWIPATASLRIESARRGGEIEVTGISGALEVANASGSVRITGNPSALAVNTIDGSVWADLDEPTGEGPRSIAIHDGSLHLSLPRGVGIDLDRRTLFNGRLVTSLEQEEVETKAGVRTRINGGGSTFSIAIHTGSVHVTTRGP